MGTTLSSASLAATAAAISPVHSSFSCSSGGVARQHRGAFWGCVVPAADAPAPRLWGCVTRLATPRGRPTCCLPSVSPFPVDPPPQLPPTPVSDVQPSFSLTVAGVWTATAAFATPSGQASVGEPKSMVVAAGALSAARTTFACPPMFQGSKGVCVITAQDRYGNAAALTAGSTSLFGALSTSGGAPLPYLPTVSLTTPSTGSVNVKVFTVATGAVLAWRRCAPFCRGTPPLRW